MKILLIGEYSNVHNNLAQGLRSLGHHVVLANDGDHWKKFDKDINLSRNIYKGSGIISRLRNLISLLCFLIRLLLALTKMRGFDIVQVINPIFLPLKAERHYAVYNYLRRHNKRMILGAMGDDYYYCYVNRNIKPMRYSDYNIGSDNHITDFGEWTYNDKVETPKADLCRYIAADCDAIIAGTYEYWLPYSITSDCDNNGKCLCEKLHYIPFPFTSPGNSPLPKTELPIKIFIGISKGRSEFKGTDILLKAAKALKEEHPDKIELRIAEGVPFRQYQHMMDTSDIMLDQIYSYGPGMNALLALSKGIATVTGGEPEHYDIMNETECRPIINTEPTYESVYEKLEWLILHPEELDELKKQSRNYVIRNHNSKKVAQQYVRIYESL